MLPKGETHWLCGKENGFGVRETWAHFPGTSHSHDFGQGSWDDFIIIHLLSIVVDGTMPPSLSKMSMCNP